MATLAPIEQGLLRAAENLLWAVAAQAVEDATSGNGVADWRADEAMWFIERAFGPSHHVTLAVRRARDEGRRIHVELH